MDITLEMFSASTTNGFSIQIYAWIAYQGYYLISVEKLWDFYQKLEGLLAVYSFEDLFINLILILHGRNLPI